MAPAGAGSKGSLSYTERGGGSPAWGDGGCHNSGQLYCSQEGSRASSGVVVLMLSSSKPLLAVIDQVCREAVANTQELSVTEFSG